MNGLSSVWRLSGMCDWYHVLKAFLQIICKIEGLQYGVNSANMNKLSPLSHWGQSKGFAALWLLSWILIQILSTPERLHALKTSQHLSFVLLQFVSSFLHVPWQFSYNECFHTSVPFMTGPPLLYLVHQCSAWQFGFSVTSVSKVTSSELRNLSKSNLKHILGPYNIELQFYPLCDKMWNHTWIGYKMIRMEKLIQQ